MILLEDDSDIAYFFNIAEEEENKEQGNEKDMNEDFMWSLHVLEMVSYYSEVKVFFHLQLIREDVFQVPVLPPPEYV